MSIRTTTENGLLLETSTLLTIPHGFTTRVGGVSGGAFAGLNLGISRGDDPRSVFENYRRLGLALKINMSRSAGARQVHGKTVLSVSEEMAGELLGRRRIPECDGLITCRPGLPLVVFSADCGTILLYDPVRRAVGAVHAGWRGTALGIARAAVEAMTDRYGSRPGDILAALGPCIGPDCFETDEDVPQAMTAALGEIAASAIRHVGAKYRVDLRALNRTWLLLAGLDAAHIDISTSCTACRPDLFWSHRRMGSERGSQAAVIALPEGGCA